VLVLDCDAEKRWSCGLGYGLFRVELVCRRADHFQANNEDDAGRP
jgi:hypothetical protein